MANKKRNNIVKDKSGWLFIGFVVIVGAILILYFTIWDSGQNGGIEESQENEEIVANIQEPESPDEGAILEEEEDDIGGSDDAEIFGMDFTLEGYEGVVPVVQGDTYYYDLDEGNYLTVMPIDMKGIVLESMNVTNEEEIDIKGATGTKYTGQSAKDGSTTYIVLVERDDYLFHVTGSELFLDNINNIIKFNQ